MLESPVTTGSGEQPPAAVSGLAESIEVEYHRAFYELRNKTLDSIAETYKSYDRTLITLSSGALALSTSFVKEIVSHPRPWSLWLLRISWFLLGTALVLILASFRSSQRSWERHLEIEEQAYQNAGRAPDFNNPHATTTDRYNTWSFRTFGLGVLCLIAFAAFNF